MIRSFHTAGAKPYGSGSDSAIRAASTSESTPSWSSGIVHQPVGGDEQFGQHVLRVVPLRRQRFLRLHLGLVVDSQLVRELDGIDDGVDPVLVGIQHDELAVLVPRMFDPGAVERLGELAPDGRRPSPRGRTRPVRRRCRGTRRGRLRR